MSNLRLIKKKNDLCMYELHMIEETDKAECKLVDIVNDIKEQYPEFKCFGKLNSDDDVVGIVFDNERAFLEIIKCVDKNLSVGEKLVGLNYVMNIFDDIISNKTIDIDRKIKLFDSIIDETYCVNIDQKGLGLAAACCCYLIQGDYEQVADALMETSKYLVSMDDEFIKKRLELVLEKYMHTIKDTRCYDYEEIIKILDIEYGTEEIEYII